MSSTPVRRTGPNARPRPRTTPRRTQATEAAEPTAALEQRRSFASPLERVFPIPVITVDALVIGALTVLALILRLWALGDRPLHHDESLHATYSWYLMGRPSPEYHYDPMMHGPLQFHMIGVLYSIFGSSTFTVRLWSALAGTALVAAPALLLRQLGRWPTYALAAILCLSPTTLYFSRFAREDMQVGLFTFLMMATVLRYFLDRRDGSPLFYRWLYPFALSFILAYAGKENIYLTIGILGAFLGALLCVELLPDLPGTSVTAALWPLIGRWFPDDAADNRWLWIPFSILLAVVGEGLHKVAHLSTMAALALPVAVLGVTLLVQLGNSRRGGLIADTLRQTPGRVWALAVAIIAVMLVLLYWPIGDPVSFGFIPGADTLQPGYNTDAFTGGLSYWLSQQGVARGSQPWYYYLLVIPLYEWLVVLFGIVGAIYVLRRHRTMTTMLFLWWTVASFGIYGWASEKMPWLTLHMVIPLAGLAAIGLVVSVTHAVHWLRYLAIVAAIFTGLISLHNSVTLAYVNGADPVEYYVYVQTSPDVTTVASELSRLQAHLGGQLPMQIDGTLNWPWVFYLRDSTRYTYQNPKSPQDYLATMPGTTQTDPVLMVAADGSDTPSLNYNNMLPLLVNRYVGFEMRLRWWNPEEYKTYAERTYPWTTDPVTKRQDPRAGQLLPAGQRLGYFLQDALSPTTWQHIMQWEIQRRPFTPGAWDNFSNSVNFYFMVRKDLVPDLSPHFQALAAKAAADQLAQARQQDPFLNLSRSLQADAVFGAGGRVPVALTSVGPVAMAADGTAFVIDQKANRILHLDAGGKLLNSWGQIGTAPGQFRFPYAPSSGANMSGGIAIGHNGHVYVADTWNHRIQEFTPDGAFVRTWGQPVPQNASPGPSQFYGPRGLAIAPNGDVYVADTGNERIQVFSQDGKYRFSFGSMGSTLGQFNEPSSLAIDAAGDVFVADYWNQRIQVMDLQGHPRDSITIPSWTHAYDEPAIAVDGRGRLFVPDPQDGRILVYSTSGSPVLAWGAQGIGAGQMNDPVSVAAGPRGQVLVGDLGNTRVLHFTVP